jgi:hypothetical protein
MLPLPSLLAAAVLFIGLSTAAPASASAACDVGAAALAAAMPDLTQAQPLLISRRPVWNPPVHQEARADGPRLPQPLADAWAKAKPSNLFVVCPELEARLPTGWRYATEEEEGARLQKPTIRLFGAPLVDGASALIHVGSVCGGLCGGGGVRHWRKATGRWRPVGYVGLWIS